MFSSSTWWLRQQKLSAAPGLRGFMYTTWLGDYTKLPAFMEALK